MEIERLQLHRVQHFQAMSDTRRDPECPARRNKTQHSSNFRPDRTLLRVQQLRSGMSVNRCVATGTVVHTKGAKNYERFIANSCRLTHHALMLTQNRRSGKPAQAIVRGRPQRDGSGHAQQAGTLCDRS